MKTFRKLMMIATIAIVAFGGVTGCRHTIRPPGPPGLPAPPPLPAP
jgi:hypothetical protein